MTGIDQDPSSVVSQGEMDALLQGLESLPPEEVSLWDWTVLPRMTLGVLPGLDAANHVLALHLQSSLSSWLGGHFRIEAQPMRAQTLAHTVAADAEAFCALVLRARAPASRGPALMGSDMGDLAVLSLERGALQALADLQFGGEGTRAADATSALAHTQTGPSAVVKQVLRRWGYQVLAALVQAWRDVSPLHWGVDQVAPNLASCLRGDPHARWLVCPFRVAFPVSGAGGFELALPWTLLEPWARSWGGRVVGGQSSVLACWPGRMRRLLDQTPLALSGRWNAGRLPLGAVTALKVGDWLPLDSQVEMKIGGVASLRGRYMASGQHVAVLVEHKA